MLLNYDDVLEEFKADLRLQQKLPATVESYARDASSFLQFLSQSKLPLTQVQPETLLAFREYLSETMAERENSVRRKVIGVRQYFRFLVRQGYLSLSPFDEMPIPERDEELAATLSPQHLTALWACLSGENLKSCRDRAIVALLCFEGIKATEIIELVWKDWLERSDTPTLTIRGQRQRTIALHKESQAALQAYRTAFDAWLRQRPREDHARYPWLLVAFKGKDYPLVLPKMTRHGLKFMLHELGEKISVPQLHSEMLRHEAMSLLIAEGLSPDAIMQHLGLRRMGNIGKHLALKRMNFEEFPRQG